MGESVLVRFSRKWISNGETESEFVSNLTRLRWLIGIFERSVVVDSRGSCIFFFSFFLLQFRSNSTNTFRLFSTFQLSGFNRPSMNFQFYMKLRNFRNRSEATRNRCSYWKLRKTTNSIETDSGTQSYKRNFETWSRCFESAPRVCCEIVKWNKIK